MDLMQQLAVKARETKRTIVFPEGNDPIIQEAAVQLACDGLVKPVLLSDDGDLRQRMTQVSGNLPIEIIDYAASPRMTTYIDHYCQEREMPSSVGKRILNSPLSFAAMMVKVRDGHGMVAGIAHPTEEVLMTSELLIGLQKNISVSSSFFLMEIPGFQGGECGRVIFADPAVNPDPSPEQLADIAVSTAQSAQDLLGWQPRVAMLSFSTHGSASHPLVDKVIKATSLARQKAPDILIDGEIQADAALVESVARKKVGAENPVAGQANILIFPDLNAANIGSKLVQRLAGAASYGPLLQGFAQPVSDLSRGATVADVVGAALMVAARDSV